MLLDVNFVVKVHDHILDSEGGLQGFAHAGLGGVEAVLTRKENHAHYAGLNDLLGIAAVYAVTIARGHVFKAHSVAPLLSLTRRPRIAGLP